MKQYNVAYNVYNSEGKWFTSGEKTILADSESQAGSACINVVHGIYDRPETPVSVRVMWVTPKT